MSGDIPITLVGNVVADPELRYTATGVAVASFRVASTPRTYDRQAGEWKDGESLFLTCNAWRQAAENAAETLTRGMRVIVHGRLRQRSYEAQDGGKRIVYEIEADDVGPSLRNATAKVTRATRTVAGAEEWRGLAARPVPGRAAPDQRRVLRALLVVRGDPLELGWQPVGWRSLPDADLCGPPRGGPYSSLGPSWLCMQQGHLRRPALAGRRPGAPACWPAAGSCRRRRGRGQG